MKRELLPSSAFTRAARRLAKKSSQDAQSLQDVLVALAEDAFQPSLKTHKLKGDLAQRWACRAGYDLRIVFRFVELNGREAILLQSVGTHDEVY
ncbi:MAG: type II toxin-antitoxin system mRNA interferase toxin, RelE/StbE family [Bythopirellula sp.]|nr:type II toxin-antitoxin system mRNA interferase toxin, RelE/StbE family [Bythopirellula sp.]